MSNAMITFGDILARDQFSDGRGITGTSTNTCRFCKEWSKPTAYYATRHLICRDCCEAKKDEKLPNVVRAEKKIAALINKDGPDMWRNEARFLAALTKTSEAVARTALAHSIQAWHGNARRLAAEKAAGA